MQPFSYQVTDTTCWITSMLNGIIFCRNAKTVSQLTYGGLHSLLRDVGVYCNTSEEVENWKATVQGVGNLERVEILHYSDDEVEEEIKNLSFHENQRMAAICDIHNGDHSILITDETKGWFHCFDPYWKNVCEGESTENYKTIPEGRFVNLQIKKTHLLSKGIKKDFRMGGQRRHLTLIRPNRRRRHGA